MTGFLHTWKDKGNISTIDASEIPSEYRVERKLLDSPSASKMAALCTLTAMFLRPLGPWYTAYMADMLASNAYRDKHKLASLCSNPVPPNNPKRHCGIDSDPDCCLFW